MEFTLWFPFMFSLWNTNDIQAAALSAQYISNLV